MTRGNNVHAYTDHDNDGIPDPGSDPDGGPGLDFSHPVDLTQHPHAYSDAAVTNLFYWNNVIHDLTHEYGFTEEAGPPVRRFEMPWPYSWAMIPLSKSPSRLALRAGSRAIVPVAGNPALIVTPLACETMTEGIVMVGSEPPIVVGFPGMLLAAMAAVAPATTGCLSGQEQMGEGWSDFFAVVLTGMASDDRENRGVGNYALYNDVGRNGPGTVRLRTPPTPRSTRRRTTRSRPPRSPTGLATCGTRCCGRSTGTSSTSTASTRTSTTRPAAVATS